MYMCVSYLAMASSRSRIALCNCSLGSCTSAIALNRSLSSLEEETSTESSATCRIQKHRPDEIRCFYTASVNVCTCELWTMELQHLLLAVVCLFLLLIVQISKLSQLLAQFTHLLLQNLLVTAP